MGRRETPQLAVISVLAGSPPSYPASVLQQRPGQQRNLFLPERTYYEEEERLPGLADKGNLLKTTNIERQRVYDRRMEWEEERWKMEREREYLEDNWRDSWGDKLVEDKFECFDNRW